MAHWAPVCDRDYSFGLFQNFFALLTPVSKRSRAARRGEISEAGDTADLGPVKEENDDVRKSIIRTTLKNENLLNKKMESLRIKKVNRKKNNALKNKLERSVKLDGVLATKIEQSVSRAKYVQDLRKSGWDEINKGIAIKNDLVEVAPVKTAEQIEKEDEDAYVDQFFEKENDKKAAAAYKAKNALSNSFALLEEEEA